jgi:hypothetical protein
LQTISDKGSAKGLHDCVDMIHGAWNMQLTALQHAVQFVTAWNVWYGAPLTVQVGSPAAL